MALYKTEVERIAAARVWARRQIENSPEAVKQLGYDTVLRDLMHYFLRTVAPSEELAKQAGLLDDDNLNSSSASNSGH